jgi:hypothetical protein
MFIGPRDEEKRIGLIGAACLGVTSDLIMTGTSYDTALRRLSEQSGEFHPEAWPQDLHAKYRSNIDTLTKAMFDGVFKFEVAPQLTKELLEVELSNSRVFARKVVATLSLLNAKNVVQESVTPSLNRAARRRGELPSFTYHVLKVRPFAAKARRQAGSLSDETASLQAIHWVRGHFKRYTSEHPLLGRHTGTFWFQPHLAGRNPQRRVAKDYDLR